MAFEKIGGQAGWLAWKKMDEQKGEQMYRPTMGRQLDKLVGI
jgi:hypothetical protein